MNAHPCCLVRSGAMERGKAGERTSVSGPHRPSFLRRSLLLIAKAIPVVILAVLPKCPVCLAAYVAVGTGIGFSVTTATYLRLSLIVACVASLIFFAAKMIQPGLRRLRIPS